MISLNKEVNISVLCNIDLNTSKQKGKILSFVEGKNNYGIKWLSSSEINAEKKLGNKVITDLNAIINSIDNSDISKFGLHESINLFTNLEWIKSKLESRESKVVNSQVLSCCDKFLKKIREKGLLDNISTKLDPLKKIVDDQIDKFSEINKQNKDNYFFKKIEEDAKNQNSSLSLTKENWELFQQLVQANNNQIFSDLQSNKHYRDLLINYAKTHFDEKENFSPPIIKAIVNFESLSIDFQKEENILETLFFIEKYQDLFKEGTLGVDSRSQPGLKKVKIQSLNHDIFYDKKREKVTHIQRFLGQGTYKVVKKRLDFVESQLLAISKRRLPKKEDCMDAEKEVEMMNKTSGILSAGKYQSVYYYNTNKGKTQLLVMPFYNLGSLKSNIKKLSQEEKMIIAQEIVKGVKEFHKNGIIHRDLKPDNIVLTKEKNEKGEVVTSIKIIDLGLSCMKVGDPSQLIVCGTQDYMPPESQLSGAIATEKNDEWAVGMIFVDLFFPQYRKDVSQFSQSPEPTNKNSIEYVVWKMLQPNMGNRMNLDEALSIIEKI